MEFPTDVLSLIRAYAKPLPRRTISDFWGSKFNGSYSHSVEDMNEVLKMQFEGWLLNEFDEDEDDLSVIVLEELADGKYNLRCSDSHDDLASVSFTMTELMKWNGEFICTEVYDVLKLEKDYDMLYQVYITKKWRTIRKKYWLEDLAGGKQFKCAKCIPCFEEGKDECSGCGFDMNIFNTEEDEEEE